MKKNVLSVLSSFVLLFPQISNAQTIRYNDPFESFFDTMLTSPQKFEHQAFSSPKMDVADLQNKIEIKAELPGMDETNINLSINDNVLTLSGDRKEEISQESKNYYLKEMSSGSFSRSIRLPKNIDESKIEAVFKNGILTISIPKTEVKEDKGTKIQIKTVQ